MNVMKPSTNAVRLDPRRVEQLKAIGAKLGLSNAGVIARMIREQIEAGVIPDVIPGVTVRRLDDGVLIQIDDSQPSTVTFDTAGKIVEALRSVANGGGGVVELQPFDASKSFSVVRQGTGIKFQVPFHGPNAHHWNDGPSFSPDLARDLAGVIEQAAG
ncbi:hypothetical protein LB524_21410 [Mesorhizobium sp. ESP6-5]|uniref:hypothetical protein n=1 Tax=Mesorhizobium sp. ESP6-5 TaxID=2876623 RepID=UPI001CCF26D1|nr:hypothetical protein [Mesorhizobium sp. ESP6-5]MBZ9757848.1 hypothetical protein [Mesorhizobium sp. ESP6-5]